MKTLSSSSQRKFPRVVRNVSLFIAVLAIAAFAALSGVSPSFAASALQKNPAAVATASYQAMDAAMNAGNVVRHPQVAAQPLNTLLAPAQASVDANASGVALYQYELTRIATFRAWAAKHTHDYSAVQVWSTFQTQRVSTQGSVSQVTGDETLHIDATVQDNGLVHQFSPQKTALMAKIKGTSNYVGVGQTNHGTALIHHTVILHLVKQAWVIESDLYTDPLEQMYQPDHKTVLQSVALPPNHQQQRPKAAQMATYNYTYYRYSAINYADAWWNSCNTSAYQCYISQGVDCANFVSQAIYDTSGGNIPGDYNNWYSIPGVGTTMDFVNAPGLYDYMVNNPDGSAYVLESDYQPETTNYDTAKWYDYYWEAPGDVVFYDWAPASGTKNHVTISASADFNGYTYVDGHTPDVNHYYWDLGWSYSGVGFFFVELGDTGHSVASQ